MMNKEQLARLKERLLSVREALVKDVDNIQKHSNDEYESEEPDINDEASRTNNRNLMLSRGEAERQKLKMIDDALSAIDSGDYGVCVDCEGEIPFERLLSVPYVERCVNCMARFEEKQRWQ